MQTKECFKANPSRDGDAKPGVSCERDSPAAARIRMQVATRRSHGMSIPISPGRIRWSVYALAAAFALCLQVATAAHAAPREREVIVQMQPGNAPAPAKAQVRRSGGRITRSLTIINGFAARVSAKEAAALRRSAGVRAVSRNFSIKPQSIATNKLVTAYPSSVNAPQAWYAGP